MTPGDRELVLDASVLVKWFHPDQEANVEGALRLLTEYENAELQVVVPPLLYIELLNLAIRRWAATEQAITAFGERLLRLRFIIQQPDLVGVARWTALGLTAYDAC